jgi:hypothetical protein
MKSWLPILIMMNNYFHDVATALLVTSAFLMYGVVKIARRYPDEKYKVFFKDIFVYLSKFALGALIWVILGGIPRTIFFKRYEWWDAAEKGIIPALLVKHVLIFTLLALGVIVWFKLRKEIN